MATATADQRLRLLYEVNRRLTTFHDLDELLHQATRQARELFGADGCSLLLLDGDRREFTFPVASQSASSGVRAETLAEIRFPADRGIAGWVLTHDEATLVADVQHDPRFYPDVDRRVHSTTRSMMCAPMRTSSGNIGVVEVINPSNGTFTADDLQFLEAFAGDVALACEKALLYRRLRNEVVQLRQTCRLAGYGFVGVGIAIGIGAAFTHLALGLPLGELAARPGMLYALLCVIVGAGLVATGAGWIVPSTPQPRQAGAVAGGTT